MKSIYKKKSKNSFIFWLPAGNEYRNLAINNNNNNNFLKIGKIQATFSPKKPSISVKNHVFQFPKKCTNLMRSSTKSLRVRILQ
jgi:hypothetical protein